MRPEVPIGDYGLVGDTRSAALVAPDGAIDWWCLPRFDSPPVFGRLVGGETAGCFEVGPAGRAEVVARGYRDRTATLETVWRTDGGELTAADGMVSEVRGQLLPRTVLVRRVVASGGPARVRVRFAPRFGYDRVPPDTAGRRGGALVCARGSLALALTGTADVPLDEPVEVPVEPGRPLTLVLTATTNAPTVVVPPDVALAALARDETGWAAWTEGVRDDLPCRDAVVRSLVTLRLLTYSPSGAPVAAPTTSLPEQPGGGRNWDYRYAWPRDASIGVGAFLRAGRPAEARAFLAWLLHASRLDRPHLPVLLTLDGCRSPAERELTGWPGYAGSRPVRVGNAADRQHQLDGYGWVVDAAYLLDRAGHRLDGETWRAVAGFADRVARTWREPDAGIWERRDDPAHHVHSKLMAWLALSRALRLAETHRVRDRRRRRWAAERDALATDIRDRGFHPGVGAYTGRYGSPDLDAAVLLLPVVEFEPAGSPRVTATIAAIRRELSAGGPLLYRYPPGNDGLAGGEGAFLPCSFWLVQALARTGQAAEAHALLTRLVELGGPLGLFAEEADPATGTQLGNYPQALTHAAFVQAALALADAGQPARP